MQITQFVVGASYAFLHLFVKYQIPVSVPYLYHVAPKIASMVASDASSVASVAVASATIDPLAFWKKFALRAAGYEGLAENVGVRPPALSNNAPPVIPQQYLQQAEQRYRDELQWVHCLDTSGQVFAILLNCLYLAPLTWLFVRFFVKAYLTQMERRRSSAASDKVNIGKSLEDATRGASRRLSQALMEMHATGDSSENESPIVESEESVNTLKSKAAAVAENSSKAAEALQQKAKEAASTVKSNVPAVAEKVSSMQKEVGEDTTSIATDVSKKADKASAALEEKSSKPAASDAKKQGENAHDHGSEVTDDKSFAAAVKDGGEPEPSEEGKPDSSSPNDDGTGVGEDSGSQDSTVKTEDKPAEEQAKKEEEKIIDESKPVREDEVKVESEVAEPQTNDKQNPSSNIPRPKKLGKKKA